MKRLSRKAFLGAVVATGAAAALPGTARAQTTNFTTIAEDRHYSNRGRPDLFGATGLAASTRRLRTAGLDYVNAVSTPHAGPYVQARLFGGHVSTAVYRHASIELTLDQIGRGYHFLELFLGSLYPYAFYDTTPVEVNGFLFSGTPVRRHVARLSTLTLPHATIRVLASFQGARLAAFDLMLPECRATSVP